MKRVATAVALLLVAATQAHAGIASPPPTVAPDRASSSSGTGGTDGT